MGSSFDMLHISTDMALHEPSGLIYLACSEPQRRVQWIPAVGRLNVAGASKDSVVVYNPENSQITKLKLSGLDENLGFSSHGIDIVPSASNPSEIFLFLVNHRPQSNAEQHGADSVVEIFKHTLKTDKLQHIKTIRDPLIVTPNGVVGSNNGESFFITNDHSQKTGFVSIIEFMYYSAFD
jgi:arylesterase/paraoxonase